MITGTVTDQSPNSALNGTPAISDEDQGRWMDYMVTKTIAEPTNVTGVDVTLQAVDPNGNIVNIGTVTSDQSGVFKKLWTPEVPGEYTIWAKFAGSQSYGGSSAETAVGISEASSATTSPPPQSGSVDNTWTIIGMGIVLLIAIVIIGVLVLRKR